MDLYLEHPHPCPYLPEQTCQNLTFTMLIENVSATEKLLTAGFRHFGTHWFIPACPECSACQGIFIDVNTFSPSKSQRKIINRNSDLRIERSAPSVTAEKVTLLNQFQKSQTECIGWNLLEHDERDYFDGFIKGNHFCEEYQIYDGAKLIGVGFLDLAGSRASSIYFFYDPDYRHRSLGTWSVISEIDTCKSRNISFLHLGLWNSECPSLAYKNRFEPYKLIPTRTIQETVDVLSEIFGNFQR